MRRELEGLTRVPSLNPRAGNTTWMPHYETRTTSLLNPERLSKRVMEPPLKRQRLSTTFEPEDDLQERRVRNDLQLKSRFETIFEKYSKDFEGIGDEIDMRTGEIVVNNGHILGMTSERDIGDFGDADTSIGGLESGYYSEDEGSHSLDDYNGSQNLILRPLNLEDTDVISQAGLDWNSDNDGDSLMGEIEVERQEDERIIESWGMTASDLEEDELANSEFAWMNPRQIRAVAHDRWQNRKQQLESLDEPNVDPAWRAPPLPISTLSLNKTEKASLTGVGDDREDSDSEARGISIWAPGKIEGQRHIFDYQSIPNDQRERHREPLSDSDNAGLSSMTRLGTCKDEDNLRHFKGTDTVQERDMEHCFPQKNDTKLTAQLLRGATPEMMEHSTSTDALITSSIKSLDEHRVHPRESFQRCRVISDSSSPQLMSDGVLSRFAGTHQQNDEQLASFDRFSQDCKNEPESGNQTNTSVPHVMSTARIYKCEEESPSLQAQTETEDVHIEEHLRQIDKALAAAKTTVNISQDSFPMLRQSRSGAGQPRLVESTERHLIEGVHTILKRKSAQTLTAPSSEVISVPDGNVHGRQNIPIDGDPPLSTMSQETTDAMQTSGVGASPTTLCQSLTDGPAHVPRLNGAHSSSHLAREQAPTADSGTSNAVWEQKLQRTSRSAPKTHTVQVVIPVVTTYTAEDTVPTVDIELDKSKSGSKEDHGYFPTRVVGEMPRHLLRESRSSGVMKSEHQLPIPDMNVDHSMQNDALSDRDQSDLEDPLCTEIPDSQPWSRSSFALESPEKQGTKAGKMSVKFPQHPRPSNKAFDNSLDSPKKQRKKPLKIAVADSFSSISEAMLECSEDELSFM